MKFNFYKSDLNSKAIFCGRFDMPYVKSHDEVPLDVIPFDMALKTKRKEDYKKWIIFYIQDECFERVWQNPRRYLPLFRRFAGVVTPDYSLSTDMPQPVKMMNTFRSKWIGSWLNSQGIKTIVNVRWCDEESLEFAFDGIEEGATVFIGTLGSRKLKEARRLLEFGFEQLCSLIKPKMLLCYGTLTPYMIELCKKNSIPFKEYKPYISRIFKGGKNGNEDR